MRKTKTGTTPWWKSFGFAVVAIVPLLCAGVPSQAGSLANLSVGSVRGSAQILSGSLDILKASGTFVIETIETGAEGSVILLRGSAEAGSVALRTLGDLSHLGIAAAGTVVEVTAGSVGQILHAGNTVIALVLDPAAEGRFHSRQIGE